MNTLKILPYIVLSLFTAVTSNVHADLDVGKGTATSTEIINEFKNNNPSDEDTVDLQDATTRGMLCKSRGLVSNCDVPATPSKPKLRKPPKASRPTVTNPTVNSGNTVCQEKGISMEVLFDYNSDALSNAAIEQLRPFGEALASEQLRGLSYRVEGHTDAVGGDAYNKELSLRRAQAVKNYLTHGFNFTGNYMEVIGKGKSNLADPANPGSEKNRRVRIVKLGC